MKPYYEDQSVTLHLGDCLAALASMGDASIDAVVTDPPYGLEFMAREWDKFGGGQVGKPGIGERAADWVSNQGWNGFRCRNCGHLSHGGSPCACGQPDFARADSRWKNYQEWCERWAADCLRVLKPGGWLLAFGGTRTWHRLACAIEDAGFEIRDSIDWIYGSGFPKNPACLKPAHEPIVMARKPSGRSEPLPGLEGCRVAHASEADSAASKAKNPGRTDLFTSDIYGADRPQQSVSDAGRWPPNLLLSHSPGCEPAGTRQVRGSNIPSSRGGRRGLPFGMGHQDEITHYADPDGMETVEDLSGCAPGCPVAELDAQSGTWKTNPPGPRGVTRNDVFGTFGALEKAAVPQYGDTGGASRFFPCFRYQTKAPRSERPRLPDGTVHPTVKPLDLMRWLVRLVTPPGGTVLDPFAGSGTTGEACVIEGFSCILAEQDPKSADLIVKRLSKPIQPVMFGDAV